MTIKELIDELNKEVGFRMHEFNKTLKLYQEEYLEAEPNLNEMDNLLQQMVKLKNELSPIDNFIDEQSGDLQDMFTQIYEIKKQK